MQAGAWQQHGVSQTKRSGCSGAHHPSRNRQHLFVDSTGIKFLGKGKWKIKRYGVERRRQWRDVHLSIDASVASHGWND